MKRIGIGFIAILTLLGAFSASGKDARLPDSAIIKILIDDSISSYPVIVRAHTTLREIVAAAASAVRTTVLMAVRRFALKTMFRRI